ncbi:hypothetical protein [Actinocorallia populi]|uniref:hypothetical protein n=1 Tax=Actinocorallia populi TaxID=2079200 RepID=UPI000D0911FB|nr:hypothetical protein [Actinocorallia populi]
MFSVPARLMLAAAVAAGGILAVPASAAPKSCLVGKWRLTKYETNSNVGGEVFNAQGGGGTRLTITKKSVKFDFSGSERVVTKGKMPGGKAYRMVNVYKKSVKFKSALRGSKKGALMLKPKSATGTATFTTVLNGAPMGTTKIAKYHRSGETDPFIPASALFTCKGGMMSLLMEADGPDGAQSSEFYYTRR